MARSTNIDAASGTARLLIAAMCVVLVLLLALAWQTAQSIRAHSETAIAVLEDYAGLAAGEFSRRAMGAVGYYGYFQTMSELRVVVAGDTWPLGSWPAVTYRFHIDSETREFRLAGPYEAAVAGRAHIVDTLLPHAQTSLPESGLLVSHTVRNGQQSSFVITWPDDGGAVYGFLVNRDWLTQTLAEVVEESTLLPASLTNGLVTNDRLYIAMHDAAGNVLYETGTRGDHDAIAVKLLTDEYDGVFRGHAVTVAIGQHHAEALIIGGLPLSRLPIVAAIIVLAVFLLVASIWQLRRENALARLRSSFVAEVSHELRTPLTQIRMFTDSLRLGRMNSVDDKNRALRIIDREAQRMTNLVENILQFSDGSGATNGLNLSRQKLAPFVAAVADEFQVIADASGARIVVELDESSDALFDSDALRQVLLNLLDNAVKYGPDQQTICVTLESTDQSVRIAVCDQGPGIPPGERERIWHGFHRLERERRSAVSGTGIGLAVVRELVLGHGGSVRVEDTRGGGACFVVEIPR